MEKSFWQSFWDLFAASVIVQSIITLLMVSVLAYMAIKQIPIPSIVENLTWGVVSFWMGTKVEYRAREIANGLKERRDAI